MAGSGRNFGIKDLSEFQIPYEGEVTLCEVDGKVHSLQHNLYRSTDVEAITNTVKKHPKVHITRDILQHMTTGDDVRTFFIETEVPFLKHLIQTYYESGALEALHVASAGNKFIISDLARAFLKLLDATEYIKNKWKLSFSELQTRAPISSPLRNIPFSNIKCLSWHPHCLKIAVACSDDTVRIYYDNASVGPILKYKQQRNISCIEWRPFSFSEIAVGCDAGVYVWNVDPYMAITRPTISNATLLHQVNHVPIASLAWSPFGELLATCSKLDSTVLVWDVEMKENSSLKRPGSAGNNILKWCNTGSKLLTTTCGPKFRVWDCLKWESELWEINSGEISAACWSPCGSALLFATSEEPFIYYLSSTKATAFSTKSNGPNEAIPIIDCSKIERNGTVVGGLVKDMEWDPEGRHVAVLFQNTNYVAVFRTRIHPVLQIFASVFIGGAPAESPCLIQFQKNFKHGACLTVAWSSGRLQHFPIVYSVEFQTTPNYSLSTSFF